MRIVLPLATKSCWFRLVWLQMRRLLFQRYHHHLSAWKVSVCCILSYWCPQAATTDLTACLSTQWIPVTGEYQRLLSGAETETVYIALKDVWLLSDSLPGTCFCKLVGRVSHFSFFLSGSHLYPNNLVFWGRDCRDEILTYAVSVKKNMEGKV